LVLDLSIWAKHGFSIAIEDITSTPQFLPCLGYLGHLPGRKIHCLPASGEWWNYQDQNMITDAFCFGGNPSHFGLSGGYLDL